ncbi:MAG: hypothetical protein ACRD8Z_02225, partial [Nitrososphaeraceae archaeon]
RFIGKIEPGQCVIVADEADRVHDDKEMLGILKEGYAILGKVPKINIPDSPNGWGIDVWFLIELLW